MKYALFLSAALLVGAGGVAPVEAQQGIDLVKQAVAAQGGADALRSLKTVAIAAQGQHWEPGQSYQPGGEGFATVDFKTLHPVSLIAERSVSAVFDIEATSGARNAIALHFGDGYHGGVGATVIDVSAPSTATARFFSGFELGGIQ